MRKTTSGLSAALLALGAALPQPACRPPAAPPAASVERMWVPLSHTPLRGPATARLTVVVFCEFASPYCARVHERIEALRQLYKDDLRVQFRHRPLPNREHSQPAAEASMAAAEQGQFWRYHDALFAQTQTLERQTLERCAQQIGLDLPRFRDALDSRRLRKPVDDDSLMAADLGLRGAPVVVVNGRPLRGVPELALLKRVFDEELAAADGLLASGVAPRELYKRLAQPAPVSRPDKSADKSADKPADKPVAAPSPPRLDPAAVYKVEVGASPARGPADAKATLVLWSDFECVQCAAAETALNAVAAAHPRDVRIVWKNRPVPDHAAALLAAEAALAAGQQGKFWPMHDLLFAQPGFERPQLEARAARLGLDMPRFRTALDERIHASQVAADLELSERLSISDLPTVFLNGRPLRRAALAPEALQTAVAEELRRADQLLQQGTPRERLYDALLAGGLDGVPEPDLSELPPLPGGTYLLEAGSSPVLGPSAAPVTVVSFSDFQCPYSARWAKTVARLRSHYGDKLRVVWKDSPDPEHTDALGAHEAARAAAEQGRFWEMHDKIFASPYLLRRAVFERYAGELGLDLGRFRGALDSGKFRQVIRDETAYGISLAGPSGTPTVFVNGRLLPGAYPFAALRRIIDEELARNAPPGR